MSNRCDLHEQEENTWRAGAFQVNVTPPTGIALAGSFEERRSDGVLDDIYVHALVIHDGHKEVAILSADIIAIHSSLTERILPGIEQATGIPRAHMIFAATHTHSAPILHTTLPEIFGHVTDSYVDHFVNSAISCVVRAQQRMKTMAMKVGRESNDHYVFNRRLAKPDGSIIMNWVSPNELADCIPTGPVDPEMIIVRIDEVSENKPIAFIVNYGNHNNCVGVSENKVSADISGHVKRLLQKVYGEDVVVIFLLGACGDSNFINWRDPQFWQLKKLHEVIGVSLAGTALSIIEKMEPANCTELRIANTLLSIPERPYCDYDTHEDNTFGPGDNRSIFDGYRRDRERYENLPTANISVPLTVLALGDQVALASNPAELFVEFGLTIKGQSPYPYTLISTLSNGECGYVPTRRAFQEGGYEVRKVKEGSYLDEGAGDEIVAATISLLNAAIKE